eukprot:171255-Pyramimonas_sp.AAC.1
MQVQRTRSAYEHAVSRLTSKRAANSTPAAKAVRDTDALLQPSTHFTSQPPEPLPNAKTTLRGPQVSSKLAGSWIVGHTESSMLASTPFVQVFEAQP